MTKERFLQSNFGKKGLTLVELLVALMVTSVILAAVATLAYALGKVSDSGNDTSEKQAQLRYATLRISELIRYSKLIYSAGENAVVLWRDDNGDDYITLGEGELVTIGTRQVGSDSQLCETTDGTAEPIALIHQCSNVQFTFDQPSEPPTRIKFVSISFDLNENGGTNHYQISAALRCWAGYMLDAEGNILQ
jgi:prepilin-type N-terminal cleavage/methylation domain-containing protein